MDQQNANRDLLIAQSWDQKAEEWHNQVRDKGDENRIYNSDPVLWRYLGNVENQVILDAGCGTGYLCRKLLELKPKKIIGVDLSPKMIEQCIKNQKEVSSITEYRVDSINTLHTIEDDSIDKLVSNYVIMDAPNLGDTVKSFYRVLKPGAHAVIIFLHPCFVNRSIAKRAHSSQISYHYESSYFDEVEFIEGPWGCFDSDFICYHRPLSSYWKAFKNVGFKVKDFDEPIVAKEGTDLNPDRVTRNRMRPGSVAFLLKKSSKSK